MWGETTPFSLGRFSIDIYIYNYIYIYHILWRFNLLECLDLHGQFPEVALQRLEEQRVELEREIKEAKDALEQLRTEAAAVEHSLL